MMFLQILLSNDINLCNKAIINSIPAYSHHTILKELEQFGKSEEVMIEPTQNLQYTSVEIKTILSHLFSFIIMDVTKSVYGEYHKHMNLLNKPPWALQDCLYRFEKLWIAVFAERIPKQFLKTVLDLTKFIKTHKSKVQRMLLCFTHVSYFRYSHRSGFK